MDSTSSFRFATLDVFTTKKFAGNPLAVVEVPADSGLMQEQKQLIAREFNFSETVFLHEATEDPSERKIDIFTTEEELPFAGHPTIGTACYVLAAASTSATTQAVTLLTKAGKIGATYDSGRAVAKIPHNVHVHEARVDWAELSKTQPAHVYDSLVQHREGCSQSFPVISIVKGMTFVLVDFPSVEGYLETLQVGGPGLMPADRLLDEDWKPSFVAPYFYVVLEDKGSQSTKVRARMIVPLVGEDPATGSAACALGAHLALQAGGAGKLHRYNIEQGVEMGRSSQIGVEVKLDQTGKGVESVALSGTAVLVTEGILSM
ncbi:MAG: hypothetical protein FRX48_04717 [Lasallia pustulata]|uniref:Phenazine biosynthesis n=1 Tax=Lasallia pustulata TaxID=136370 RepID=A0A5M8PR32_9LECA|nr:MAG: hypothetical protein FRX48_04717 [Lasallia pustulata]